MDFSRVLESGPFRGKTEVWVFFCLANLLRKQVHVLKNVLFVSLVRF